MATTIGTDLRVTLLGADESSRPDLTALAIYNGLGANVIVIHDIDHFRPDLRTDWRRAMDRMFKGVPGIISHTASPNLISKRKARRLRGKARA